MYIDHPEIDCIVEKTTNHGVEIDGLLIKDGAISGYVPYSGASQDVNLGAYDICGVDATFTTVYASSVANVVCVFGVYNSTFYDKICFYSCLYDFTYGSICGNVVNYGCGIGMACAACCGQVPCYYYNSQTNPTCCICWANGVWYNSGATILNIPCVNGCGYALVSCAADCVVWCTYSGGGGTTCLCGLTGDVGIGSISSGQCSGCVLMWCGSCWCLGSAGCGGGGMVQCFCQLCGICSSSCIIMMCAFSSIYTCECCSPIYTYGLCSPMYTTSCYSSIYTLACSSDIYAVYGNVYACYGNICANSGCIYAYACILSCCAFVICGNCGVNCYWPDCNGTFHCTCGGIMIS